MFINVLRNSEYFFEIFYHIWGPKIISDDTETPSSKSRKRFGALKLEVLLLFWFLSCYKTFLFKKFIWWNGNWNWKIFSQQKDEKKKIDRKLFGSNFEMISGEMKPRMNETWGGGGMAQWLAYLLSGSSCPVFESHLRSIFLEKFPMLLC